MEPNSELILIERISSGNHDESGFLTNLTNVKVGNGAKLHRILIQNLDLNSTFHNLENFEIQRNSSLSNVSIQLGSAQARIETKGNLLETGANFENYALTLGKKDQLIDTRTMQHHLASNGRSDLVCKNALLDDSKIVFSGLIKVDERASFSDALQTNRNLLMSSDCEADSLPGLEILANEVKCSHGATSSRVDDKELFYFLSRGIHKSESEKLIALGFLDEIIQKINLADQIEIVRGLISGSFPKN
jgi:Fe-S cluster assembly protein SufD